VLAALPPRCAFVTLSLGAVACASPPATVDELLRRADQALYVAKREGKDRLRLEAA
jgi:PleD family two-component response regulator